MRLRIVLVLLSIAGCRESRPLSADAAGLPPDDEMAYEDDDLPAGGCRGTGTDTDPCETEGTTLGSGAGAPAPNDDADACQSSDDCMGAVCAASFDPATLRRGLLACQFACVPLVDDTLWCSDDASCCERGAVCTQRGYCVMPETDTTGT